MYQSDFFILTGAMGGGKSAVTEFLNKMNSRNPADGESNTNERPSDSGLIECIPEPARKILHEQRLISAPGVPETDPNLFTQLMLSRATKNYTDCTADNSKTYIFDRGIPDLIAYAQLFKLDTKIYYNAARAYKYNPHVFLFEGWEDIYTTDDERKMTYIQAKEFGDRVAGLYRVLGYSVIEVPKISINERAEFVCEQVKKFS